MVNRTISWGYQALRQFNKAILYIVEDSLQNAENVRADVIEEITVLPDEALKKVYYKSALRIVPGLDKSAFRQ